MIESSAWASAFGLADDGDPDPFEVALAAYQLVCDAADATPLVVMVEDAHSIAVPGWPC